MLDRVRLRGTDLVASRLCLGGNVFGWTADERQSFAILDAYRAAGGNFVDTADVYASWHPGNAGGESEQIIGRWLRSRGRATEMIIATKGGLLPPYEGLSPRAVTQAIDGSLRRLGVDHIDLWYAHRDDPGTPQEETAAALDAAVRAGKVRYLGASNFAADRLGRALAIAATAGVAYRAVQVRHNLIQRSDLTPELADLAAQHDLSVLGYSALAAGVLTGKYRSGAKVDSGRDAARAESTATRPTNVHVLTAQRAVAERHGVSMTAVAISWLLARPAVTCAIASARHPDQLTAILDGLELELTADDRGDLDG